MKIIIKEGLRAVYFFFPVIILCVLVSLYLPKKEGKKIETPGKPKKWMMRHAIGKKNEGSTAWSFDPASSLIFL